MSGGGKQQTVTQQSGPPEWAVPYLQNYYQQAQATAAQPYTPYDRSRVTDLNDLQYNALDATANRAMQGSQEVNAARQQLTNTINGGFLGQQAPGNMYAGVVNQAAGVSNPYAGVANQAAGVSNPFAGVSNQFAGLENPYLRGQIDQASQDVVRNYNLAVRPQLDTAMARSGSFGNSGVQQMESEAQRNLAGQLGNIAQNMRFQDYGQQVSLSENQANRLFGAGQQQSQNLFNAGAQQAQNLYGSGQQQAQNVFGAYQQQANNLFGAGESQAGRQQALNQFERGNQMQAIGMAPQFGQQDYIDAQQLANVGNTLQNQQQRYADDDYQRFFEARQYPQQQLGILGSAFGFGPGATESRTTPTGGNRGAGALGGALGGAQLGMSVGGPWGALAGAAGGGLLGGK
ncbi:hypothetical protein IP84_17055 [beta proteobacterium AAP99]|nr:hypothetical protein IP84_17055 [beta proteobacterium AAP99]